jgi:hypothetical protein
VIGVGIAWQRSRQDIIALLMLMLMFVSFPSLFTSHLTLSTHPAA